MREKTAEEEQTAKYKESEGPLSPDESNSESLHLYDDEDYLKLKQLIGDEDSDNVESSFHKESCNKPTYRPFQSPPDFKLAQLHGLAKKIGKISSYATQFESGQVCVCCHLPFHKTPFRIGEPIEKFASLGTAFTLFFLYIKQMLILLTIYFLVGGLQNLIETYASCDESQGCASFLGIIYSRDSDKSCSDEFYTRQVLDFIAFWLLFIGVILCKIFQDNKDSTLKKSQASHADFTIIIRNVHESPCEEDLKVFLEQRLLPDRSIEIIGINRVFKIQEYYQLAREKQYRDAKNQVQSSPKNQDSPEQVLLLKMQHSEKTKNMRKEYAIKRKKIESDLHQNAKQIQILEDRYSDYQSEGTRTDIVIVTFNKVEDCTAIKYRYFRRTFRDSLEFCGRVLKFRPASEPLDIIWENLETPLRVKFFRRSIFLFLAVTQTFPYFFNLLMLTVGSLFSVSGMTLWQKKLLDERTARQKEFPSEISKDMVLYLLSFICMIIIATINSLLTIVISLFSKHEKHSTFTQTSVSVGIRLSWIQFINTTLAPFVILLILTQEDNQEYLQFVTQNVFFIFIGNAILVPITVTMEPEYLWKRLTRWWVTKRKATCTKTQQELNLIFEDPEFLIQEYYAIVNRIVLSGFFYATMLSLGILIKCLTLLVLYWSFKFTFVRHSAYPKCLSNSLNSQMQQIMFFIPIIFVSGNLAYGKILLKCENSELYSSYNIISLSFGIALIFFHNLFVRLFSYFYLPTHKFDSYKSESRFMGITYAQANPITRAFDPENNKIELLFTNDIRQSALLCGEFVDEEVIGNNESDNCNNPVNNINNTNPVKANNALNILSFQGSEQSIACNNKLNQRTSQSLLESGSPQKRKPRQLDRSADNYKHYYNNNTKLALTPAGQNPKSLFEITKKNAHSSIINYAFSSVLLSRERQNQIIFSAFERKVHKDIYKRSMCVGTYDNNEIEESEEDISCEPKRETTHSSF